MSQLILPLRLDDHAVFTSFHPAGNETLVAELEQVAGGNGSGAWIYGGHAVGKTHLLQAVCAAIGDNCVYLSRDTLASASPALLEGLAARQLVAIDDSDALFGDPDWELALFTLFNELQYAGGQLLIAAQTTQRESPVRLADLASRLRQLPTFRVQALDDAARINALKLRAGHRGLDLPDETAHYMLNRSRRDMRSLYELLDHLDVEALRAQRRLTVPFVRDVLKSSQASVRRLS